MSLVTRPLATPESTNFIGRREFLDANNTFVPVDAVVDNLTNGPDGVTGQVLFVNKAQDYHLNPEGKPTIEPVGMVQLVITATAVNYRVYGATGFGEWAALTGGTSGGDSGLSTKVTTLEGKVSTLESKVTALEGLIDSTKAEKWNGYDARITALESA